MEGTSCHQNTKQHSSDVAMMDEQAYLEPGFDPASLTVPQLRSVLVARSVNYPSSAKKTQLIDLFNEHVAPQAKQLRNASLRVKRSSRGILDVASQSTQSTDNDEDELPPPPSTARRSGGRTTRARTEEAEEVPPPSTARRTRHSTAPPEATPRRASSKHARTVERVEEEIEPEPKRPTSRRSRQSVQTPSVREGNADESSPFSAENVFQSGSSPPPPTDRRRTTMSATKDADRRRSDKVRRRTEIVKPIRQQMDGAVVPTRRTFEMPVSALKKERIEPTEEFTPEEEQELALAQQSGELVQVRPTNRTPAAKAVRNGFSAIFVAVLAASAYLYSDEKYKVGYCGHGEPSSQIAGVQIPEWADQYRPSCEPCPPHAICYDKFETACESGFVLTQHPLSLNGVFPLPPSCEPDTVRTKRVNLIKEKVIEDLREQNAAYECGDAPTPELEETALKQKFKPRKSMSNQEFQEMWDSALDEVRNVDEVIQGVSGSDALTLRSSSLRNLSISCSIRRSLRQTLRQYVYHLVTLSLVVTSGLYGKYTFTSSREVERTAKLLTGRVYEVLRDQAAAHATEPGTFREGHMSVAQLRDDIMRDEYSTWKRQKVWEAVQKKVERNSNVRPMVREARSGDVGRVWEWVGAVGMLESPPTGGSRERRKSGRVSFGGEQWIEPRREEDEDLGQVTRWKEGGQYY